MWWISYYKSAQLIVWVANKYTLPVIHFLIASTLFADKQTFYAIPLHHFLYSYIFVMVEKDWLLVFQNYFTDTDTYTAM